MKFFELIEHVADVRLKLKADSLEELFLAAVQGMAELFVEDSSLQATHESTAYTIHIQAPDSTSLLIDFLAAILAQTHTSRIIYHAATFEKLTETEVKVTLSGHKVRHFDEDIKAVTYHEAEVVKDSRGIYETMVIFDI